MVVGLGPAIAPGRYQVGAEVAEAAARAFGERASAVLHPAGPEQWRFDLWTANRMVLQAAGVPGGQIHGTGTATGPITPASGPQSPDGWFFSHRAERPCGRFGLLARLRPRESR